MAAMKEIDRGKMRRRGEGRCGEAMRRGVTYLAGTGGVGGRRPVERRIAEVEMWYGLIKWNMDERWVWCGGREWERENG
jgi:hypothetical protein